MPSALTSFLVSKVFDKPFIVDPMTHVFQHSLSNISSDSTGDPRKSLLKLAFALGDPVVSKLNGQEPVTPVDFCGSNSVDKFVRRAVSFQLEGFRHSAEESGDIEYFHYLGIDNPLEPYFVVAPYFYMDETNIEQWWKLNLEFLDRAVSLFGKKHRVICQMVVDEGALEHSRLTDYIASVGVSNAWGVAIWVDNLDETTASSKMLSRYVNVIRALGATKRVIIPYGSYFPVALSHSFPSMNIAGVCHSLEYGEFKPVVPVGGGPPLSKFYYPSLHARVPFAESLRLARKYLNDSQSYLSHVCSCPVCIDLMSRTSEPINAFLRFGETKPIRVARRDQEILRNFPTLSARDLCVKHYLHCKNSEYTTRVTAEEVISKLRLAGEWAASMGSSAGKHCIVWANVISGVRQEYVL